MVMEATTVCGRPPKDTPELHTGLKSTITAPQPNRSASPKSYDSYIGLALTFFRRLFL